MVRLTKERRSGFFAAFVFLFGLVAALGADSANPAKKELPGADIFDAPGVIKINILISNAGINQLRRSPRGMGQAQRPEVRATVTDGTRVYTNVALHLKGAAGSFQDIEGKPAMTLNFDKLAEGQTFHGLKKLSLNNSVQDGSYLNEKISRELFAAAGVPVPRADYALVSLNGRNLGLYVLLEGYNKQFLKHYFKDVSGNLYDGGFCQEVSEDLNINSGDKPNEHPGMRRMIQAANKAARNRADTNNFTELSKVIDMDRFLSMLAMEMITCHWDGYSMNKNNYRVYHDKDQDKMVFMPHGMDQMFALEGRRNFKGTIFPSGQGYVSAVVLNASTEARDRYAARFWELRTNVFNAEKIIARAREIGARLSSALTAEQGRGFSAEGFCNRIRARDQSLDRLAGIQTPSPTTAAFGTNNVLKLTGWTPQVGNANFAEAKDPSGKAILRIAANGASSSASWRTPLFLNPGRYIFEGMAKTVGVRNDGGADLRISGSQSSRLLQGDTEWTRLYFAFDLTDNPSDVVFVAELKGGRGEVWFDKDSLRLRKVAAY